MRPFGADPQGYTDLPWPLDLVWSVIALLHKPCTVSSSDLRRARVGCGAIAAWVLATAALAQGTAATDSAAPASGVEGARPSGLVGTVLGIVDYSRWPGAPRPLTLCVAGLGPQSTELINAVLTPNASRPLSIRQVPVNASPPGLCDAVYFEGWREPEQRDALAALASRPVLTLGSGAGFCSGGGLFCLQPAGAGTRFSVNTDAVARSGLVVNARVLQLGRRGETR